MHSNPRRQSRPAEAQHRALQAAVRSILPGSYRVPISSLSQADLAASKQQRLREALSISASRPFYQPARLRMYLPSRRTLHSNPHPNQLSPTKYPPPWHYSRVIVLRNLSSKQMLSQHCTASASEYSITFARASTKSIRGANTANSSPATRSLAFGTNIFTTPLTPLCPAQRYPHKLSFSTETSHPSLRFLHH